MARVELPAKRETPSERRAREAREAAAAAAAEANPARRGEDDDQEPRQPEPAAEPVAAAAPAVPAPAPEPQPAAPAPTPAPAAAAAPAGGTGAVELLPDDADPAEIVARCEGIIIGARVELEAKAREIEAAWLSHIAPAVQQMHRTKAYRTILSPSGTPYRSFRKWAKERCGVSPSHAYRIVDEGPVAEALASVYTGRLTTRQVEVLAPVLRQHGPQAVRHVWKSAEATGSTGAPQLKAMAQALGYTLGTEDHEPAAITSEAVPVVALDTVRKAAQADRETLRRTAVADPSGAQTAVMAALRFASEMQQVLDELGKPGESSG